MTETLLIGNGAELLPPEELLSPQDWARRIRADLGQAVIGFIAAGRDLLEAKRQIPHGGWENWVRREVGISPAAARMLVAIAEHSALANRQHVNDLPPSWGTLYELSRLDPPLLEAAIQSGRVTPDLERDDARKLVIEIKTLASEVNFEVFHGDFRKCLADLKDESVDAIITDPPYPAEYLPLYADLSEQAARWLKPGGICAVMSGQSYLPQVMAHLTESLNYHWTIAYLTPGGQSAQIWQRKVNTFWKPIIVCAKGDAGAEWIGDVAKSDVNDNDKRFHHWGQSESGMSDLVKRLTQPGHVVLDPFMGAGTTGIVCLANGRSFVGCDLDNDHVETARARLEQTILDRVS